VRGVASNQRSKVGNPLKATVSVAQKFQHRYSSEDKEKEGQTGENEDHAFLLPES
jgi:hypothetical protein